jgi:L-threonylcarbamoyladenylate synthase
MAALEPYHASRLSFLVERVRAVVEARGIVGLPTETFYGLGANPFDEQAVARLLQIKGRHDGKPVLVLIGERNQLPLLTTEVTPTARLLMDAFWPGPVTILFPTGSLLPDNLTAGTGAIGIRLSSCVPLVALLKEVGPLTGTSANYSGQPPARTAEEVVALFGTTVDLVVDAGAAPGGLPSTIVDSREPVRLIREGAISRQTIENVLQTHGISLA